MDIRRVTTNDGESLMSANFPRAAHSEAAPGLQRRQKPVSSPVISDSLMSPPAKEKRRLRDRVTRKAASVTARCSLAVSVSVGLCANVLRNLTVTIGSGRSADVPSLPACGCSLFSVHTDSWHEACLVLDVHRVQGRRLSVADIARRGFLHGRAAQGRHRKSIGGVRRDADDPLESGDFWAPSSKVLPSFDNSTASNVTSQLGVTAYLHCLVNNLGDKTSSSRISTYADGRLVQLGPGQLRRISARPRSGLLDFGRGATRPSAFLMRFRTVPSGKATELMKYEPNKRPYVVKLHLISQVELRSHADPTRPVAFVALHVTRCTSRAAQAQKLKSVATCVKLLVGSTVYQTAASCSSVAGAMKLNRATELC
ncbi:kin of IRRE protein 3-like [Tropilaelaps mercedesae]|uniref:Kin of IRRE protein 3-like n=1 Tax=Tropilaelaps mercedesae TaxID=418985 RepID=A0A1V9X0T3_9ACAR|nr:kin of IRRE protein 3-like [Tropilaelaps mercedesae]